MEKAFGLLLGGAVAAVAAAPGCRSDQGQAQPAASASVSASASAQLLPAAAGLTQQDCRGAPAPRMKDGRISGCVLAQDKQIDGVACKARGMAQLYDDGRLERCRLAQPRVWATIPCDANRTVSFHPSRALKSCVVPDVYEVAGAPCKWQIELHANGSLARCRLAKTTKLGGREVPQRANVVLSPAGALERIEVPINEPLPFAGFDCTHLHLWPSGEVKACAIGRPATVGAESFPAGAMLCFDETGKRVSDTEPRCWGGTDPAPSGGRVVPPDEGAALKPSPSPSGP